MSDSKKQRALKTSNKGPNPRADNGKVKMKAGVSGGDSPVCYSCYSLLIMLKAFVSGSTFIPGFQNNNNALIHVRGLSEKGDDEGEFEVYEDDWEELGVNRPTGIFALLGETQ